MKIIHIMADGTVRDSVRGTVIQSEHFYQVLQGIMGNKTYIAEGKHDRSKYRADPGRT